MILLVRLSLIHQATGFTGRLRMVLWWMVLSEVLWI